MKEEGGGEGVRWREMAEDGGGERAEGGADGVGGGGVGERGRWLLVERRRSAVDSAGRSSRSGGEGRRVLSMAEVAGVPQSRRGGERGAGPVETRGQRGGQKGLESSERSSGGRSGSVGRAELQGKSPGLDEAEGATVGATAALHLICVCISILLTHDLCWLFLLPSITSPLR